MESKESQSTEDLLRKLLVKYPEDWGLRKQLAVTLFNEDRSEDAAEIIWDATEIPNVDLEIAFAAKILSRGAPRRAIRLLTSLLEQNQDRPAQNLGMANALLHHGMVMQAARFYGAALHADPNLANPDLENFLIWTDDYEKIWGTFERNKPDIGELPWMKRDKQVAEALLQEPGMHTTPMKLPQLPVRPGEQALNELYVQSGQMGAQAPPPPAVTIPMDRVQPKDRVFDNDRGAVATSSNDSPPSAEEPADTAPVSPIPVRPSLILPGSSAAQQSSRPVLKQPQITRQPLPVQKTQAHTPGTSAPYSEESPPPEAVAHDSAPEAVVPETPVPVPAPETPVDPTIQSGPPKLLIKRAQTPLLENGKLRLPPKE